MDFSQRLRAGQQRVDQALALLLPVQEAFPAVIHESMRYSALAGGKRLRGVLVLEAAVAAGAPRPVSLPAASPAARGTALTPAQLAAVGPVLAAAAAVEMVHTYSLIHDDLPCMDDDDWRRGQPTNHRVYGEGIAVLAGDALLTRAFEVVSRLPWAGCEPAQSVQIAGELAIAAGTGGLIGGQVVDLEAERRPGEEESHRARLGGPADDAQLLEYIHTHKTGALFCAAARIGALAAGADEPALAALGEYAKRLGLAFQIVDDLLDIEGDERLLGKGVGADARRGKLTYPALYGVEAARRRARDEVEAAKAALAPFGERASFLEELAEFTLARRS